jgi:pantothenate kinase
MTTTMRETASDEDRARLRLRSSLLEYLERKTEHHDELVLAVVAGTAHRRSTMLRLAQLLVQRDIALEAHLDLLAETGDARFN